MLQKLRSSINHTQLTRLPLTTFISTNTNWTVDHSKKPFFPSYYINGTVKNTFLAFTPWTIRFVISLFWVEGGVGGGGGGGGGGGEGGGSKFILKNGKGERENGNRTENGGS